MMPSLVFKELRAQAPVFAASLLAVAASAAFTRFRMLGPFAYVLGAAALGAMAIGHEYTYRTLGALLSQPVPRHRLLLAKLGVLLPMLIAVSAVAVVSLDRPPDDARFAFIVLPVAAGLCVTPWLTMICRGPLAGAVFTLTLPGLILSTSALAYLVLYGHGPGPGFDILVASRATVVLCAIGSVMTWPAFRRLEASDGPEPEVRLPQWSGRDTAGLAAPAIARRSAIVELVKKELRLQHMALAVTGVYLFGWAALTLSLRMKSFHAEEVFAALTLPYGGLIAMLIGSLASAEERRYGTLEWQLLLPVASWRQWAVKVATVVALALLLALGVPMLLAAISGARVFAWFNPTLMAADAVFAIGSLYVSSLSGSGVVALLASAPALMAGGLLLEFLFTYPGRWAFEMAARASGWPSPRIAPTDPSMRAYSALSWVIGAGVVALGLRFALANHRSAERAVARVRTQVVWLVLAVTTAVTLLAAARAWLRVPL